MKRTYQGGCHCGAVRFEVSADLKRETLVKCNCSICSAKGFLHLIVEPERFRLLGGEEAITEYRFGTMQAIHKFCARCGIHPFYTPRSHPEHVDVNVTCLDRFEDLKELWIEPFDGRNWEDQIGALKQKVNAQEE